MSVSSPYVLPTAYVSRSSYLIPSYIESSYTVSPSVSLLPTGYVETTVRRGLFGRRWVVERPVVASYPTAYIPTTYVSGYVPTTYVSSYVPTTYVSGYVPTTYVSPTYYATGYRVRRYRPTTYTYYPTVYPTVYETAYTTSSDSCYDDVAVDTTIRSVPQSEGAVSALSRPPREVESGSMDANAIDSNVTTPLPEDLARQRSIPYGAMEPTMPQTKDAASPPTPPAADAAAAKGQTGAPGTQKNAPAEKAGGSSTASKKAAPAAPAGDLDDQRLLPAPGDDGAIRSESKKPAVYPRLRTVDRRNILFGTVETEAGQPRGEVPVTVINRNGSSIRHNGVTDAFGAFAIRVPDGQWVVRVTMPSGTMQTVRNITVTGGRVVDNLELREVQNLIISF